MSRFQTRILVACLTALALGGRASAASADAQWPAEHQDDEYHYDYVSLDDVALPPGFVIFDPVKIDESRRVYATAHADEGLEFLVPYAAVYQDGVVTVDQRQPALVGAANRRGTAGGAVVYQLDPFIAQAALFHEGGEVELVPRQPGEVTSSVAAINDSDTALVLSYDQDFVETRLLYRNGRTTRLDFGPEVSFAAVLAMNDRGTISGTTASDHYYGFRFDPRTGETTRLDPILDDPEAWALDINDRGDVLGYSFEFGSTERIGVWRPSGEFVTYFVEGTPEVPTLSNVLRFNNSNLIAITWTTEADGYKSYLVPRKGVRLDLDDLVDGLPDLPARLWYIADMNDRGDMVGFGLHGNTFLLRRTGCEAP